MTSPVRFGRLGGALRVAIGVQWRAARRDSIEVIALQVADALVLAGQLFAVQQVLSHLSGTDPHFSQFVPALVGLGLCYMARAVFAAIVRERREVIGELVRRDVTLRVLAAASTADVATFEDATFHDRLRRVRTETYTNAWNLVWALVNLGTQVSVTVSMVAVLVVVSPLTLAVCLLGVGPFLWAARRRNRFSYALSVEQATRDRERSYLEELMVERSAVPELRSLDLGSHLLSRTRELYAARIGDVRAWASKRLRMAVLGGVASSVISAGAFAVLLAMALQQDLGIARLGVAVLALQQLLGQLRGLTEVASTIDAAVPFLADFRTFEDEFSETRRPAEAATPQLPPLHTLELEGLCFTYPGTAAEVLHGLDLTIGHGEIVALVGHNGSGKSTLAKLLAGLYPPSAGTIRWNGEDLASLDPHAVRRSVAVVFQDFLRYELSVADNVAFGDIRRAGDAGAITDALSLAGADPFVARLSRGAATRLSRSYEEGAELSGGQWQRLAMARAFFRDAPLLVLDEPSAALDPVAERELFDDLRRLCACRTVVMISHRFSTVRNADRILVLDQGRLVESGDHESLMALDGRYASLFRLQASPYIGEF